MTVILFYFFQHEYYYARDFSCNKIIKRIFINTTLLHRSLQCTISFHRCLSHRIHNKSIFLHRCYQCSTSVHRVYFHRIFKAELFPTDFLSIFKPCLKYSICFQTFIEIRSSIIWGKIVLYFHR